MSVDFLSRDEAITLLRNFRTQFMKNEHGATSGLVDGFHQESLSIGIVEDCICDKKYRKKLKEWLQTQASLTIVQKATQLEVVCVGETSNHLVCYDDTLAVGDQTKRVRCILSRSKAKEGVFELYVDTAFFDGGKVW